MKLKELLDAYDCNREGEEKIQICTKEGDWDDYDELVIYSDLLDLIENKEVKCLGAISEDCIRVDIDWNDNND